MAAQYQPTVEKLEADGIKMLTVRECANEAISKTKFKVVIAGNSKVGKTSLKNIMTGKSFDEDHKQSFGADAAHLEFEFRGKTYHLCLYDTAGLEDNMELVATHLKDADCVIMAYSIEDKGTLKAIIDKWLPFMEELKLFKAIKVVHILGTKADLRRISGQNWKIDFNITGLEGKYGVPFFMNECSSKTMENVTTFFWSVVKELWGKVPVGYPEERSCLVM